MSRSESYGGAGHSSDSPRRDSETSSSHGVAVILISSSAGTGSMIRVSWGISSSSMSAWTSASGGTSKFGSSSSDEASVTSLTSIGASKVGGSSGVGSSGRGSSSN